MGGISYSSIGFDGDVFLLEASSSDGSIVTARLAPGTHTDADHDAALVALRQAYPILQQWAADAANADANWATLTAAAKDNALHLTVKRLGLFFGHFSKLLVALNADT